MVNKFFDAFLWLLIGWLFFPQLNSSRSFIIRNSNPYVFFHWLLPKENFSKLPEVIAFYPQHGTKFLSFISSLKVSRALEQENFLSKPSLPYTTSVNTKAALCHTQQCQGHRSRLSDMSTHFLLTPQLSHLLCHTLPNY